jgi:hypothetical protein
MKLLRVLSVLMLASTLCAGVVHAADKADKAAKSNDVTARLEANDRKILEAIKAKDLKTFMDMVDPNGMSADAMGFMPTSGMGDMMKDMDMRSYTIDGYKTIMIDHDAYISTFTWTGDASYKGQAMPNGPYYCSTVWRKKGDDWKAVYHQESLAMQPPPVEVAH